LCHRLLSSQKGYGLVPGTVLAALCSNCLFMPVCFSLSSPLCMLLGPLNGLPLNTHTHTHTHTHCSCDLYLHTLRDFTDFIDTHSWFTLCFWEVTRPLLFRKI